MEIDFFRGLALIAIALDHITTGILSHFTLHRYAFCDSAEVFVFISGYACASSWLVNAPRSGQAAATRRFVRRSGVIYAAYLLTAVLMLLGGAFANFLHIEDSVGAQLAWMRFTENPVRTLANIALFRDQPYLAGVLPMYVVLMLLVPAAVPLVRRSPGIALSAAFGVWLVASWIGQYLPDSSAGGWAFNPFAWQAMFMLGLLSRVHPPSHGFLVSAMGRTTTGLAIGVILAIAFIRVFVESEPTSGYLKQNLATVRVVSFVALAWLGAWTVRAGWIRRAAMLMPGIVTIGQQSLVCFVGGALTSVLVDCALRLTHSNNSSLLRLAGDTSAILTLLIIARVTQYWKSARTPIGIA
ncbi:OpgC domain-containing protein [Paraburkholderia sp. EG285A]|uniref:OpgC domain-containing protein n=1 Tax=Paraburkholderia sp. EG285A TaxID=3237009 RepID=UPI0034D242DB